jgi:phage-related protein
LINNKQFVENHPQLQQFLQTHPGVREEFTEDPNVFMRQEARFDRREDAGFDRDTTRGELANMDRFFDSHPEIEEQLRKDPSLINNKQFVENHPQLQEFLQTHPGVREELNENPNAFMRQEERFERHDTTRAELANMDRFFDSHPEISEQLRKDPSLINNKQFVENHPQLQQFLQTHSGVREEFTEDPNAFMRQEARFDQREDAGFDRDRDRGEMSSFSQFLGGHATLGQQLAKDPSLANNKEFLEGHPELRDFLKEHPGMKQELAKNPQAVMSAPELAGNLAPGNATSLPKLTPKHKQ